MKQKILLLSTLICINSYASHVGSVHIINDTDQSLRAEIGIPDHSRADITIKKFNAQEETLQQTIPWAEETRKMSAFIEESTYWRDKCNYLGKPTFTIVINVPYGTNEFRTQLNELICNSRHRIQVEDGGSGGPIKLVYRTYTPVEFTQAIETVNQQLLPLEILKKYAQAPGSRTIQYESVWPMAIKSPHCFVELLELFVKNGANPNQEILSSSVGTPLHCAVFANNLSAVKFLINVGAYLNKRVINLTSHKGGLIARAQTPLSYARILDGEGFCRQEIIDFLVKCEKTIS